MVKPKTELRPSYTKLRLERMKLVVVLVKY